MAAETKQALANRFVALQNDSARLSRVEQSLGRLALYDLVEQGRNEALHQGAFARHLAEHAIELALALEDALANGDRRVVFDADAGLSTRPVNHSSGINSHE